MASKDAAGSGIGSLRSAWIHLRAVGNPGRPRQHVRAGYRAAEFRGQKSADQHAGAGAEIQNLARQRERLVTDKTAR